MTTLQRPPTYATPPFDDPANDLPRNISTRTVDDVASLVGSAAASLALVWVLYEKILAFSGIIGFVLCWWFVFLLFYAGVTALSNPLPSVIDRAAASIVTTGAVIVGSVLVFVIVYVVVKGWPALHHWNFYTQNMDGVGPTDPLTKGGIWFAVVGSVEQVGMATAISLPLGIGTAIFLAEVGGKSARVVRTVVEAMTALPDILAGLFIYTVLIHYFGWQRDGVAVAISLAVTMVPIVARSAEVVLRVVPGGLREASLALGASSWGTTWRVVLPTARAGLTTALILGIARVAGETAPLLIVDQATQFWNTNPTKDPQASLPLLIITDIRNPEPNLQIRGYGAAVVLLAIVMVLFITARLASRDKVSGGKRTNAPNRAVRDVATTMILQPIPGRMAMPGGVPITDQTYLAPDDTQVLPEVPPEPPNDEESP